MDHRHAGGDRSVVERKPCWEVVRGVDDDVVCGNEVGCIFLGEPHLVKLDLYPGVERSDSIGG